MAGLASITPPASAAETGISPLRRSLNRFRNERMLAPGIDESIWDALIDWYEPPEFLRVDVNQTINLGRFVAAPPDHGP